MITADVVVARAAAVVAVAAVVVAQLTIQTAPGHRPPTRTCQSHFKERSITLRICFFSSVS